MSRYADKLEQIAKKSSELYDVLTKKILGQDAGIQKIVQDHVDSKLAGESRKEKPGALTSYVNEHPACILLINEIKKPHISVQMQFPQILEGAS